MNSKKKILKLVLILSLVFIPSTHRTNASTIPTNNTSTNQNNGWTYEIFGDNMLKTSEGEYLVFETEQDLYNHVKSNLDQNTRACLPGDPGYPHCDNYIPTKQTKQLVSTINYSKHFMGYNKFTKSWSKASSYSLTMTSEQSFTIPLTYDNISFSVNATLSKGVTINIPADSTRFSKLGFLADITAKKYKVTTTNANTGEYINSYYYIVPSVTDTYNVVVYQKKR